MKKLRKVIAIAAVLFIGTLTISAYAASYASGSLNGHKTEGESTVGANSAGAYTRISGSGSVRVSSTYYYLTSSMQVKNTSKSSGGTVSCSVNFSGPSGAKSEKIVSRHSVSAYGSSWSSETSKSSH